MLVVVSSSTEARREQMALAKLNVEHLKRKQELERTFTELNYARELMEAKMEAERAFIKESGPAGLREPVKL